MGEGGAHILKRYEATNEWFGINRGLLLFMVLNAMQAYTSIRTLTTHNTPTTFHVHSLRQLATRPSSSPPSSSLPPILLVLAPL